MSQIPEIEIRECRTVDQLTDCVRLQREIFALPELEISPVRHFIVTMHAGGFTLGAFHNERLIGFCLSVPAMLYGERAFYSHMTAVDKDFQSFGIGSQLKWKQRERSLAKGVKFIKWTFQPGMARNAYFNLEKLGAIVRKYMPNFYGTDYSTSAEQDEKLGLESDRLIAEWHLESEKVKMLGKSGKFNESQKVARKIVVTDDWNSLIEKDPTQAIKVQTRIKSEFQAAFSENLICRGFDRNAHNPAFLLYKN